MKKLILVPLCFVLFAFNGFSQFKQEKLPYSYSALEPYIDSMTMSIHYNNHHASYTSNLNNTLSKYPSLQKKDITELLKNINTLPVEVQTSVRNNGGGFYNHNLFWQMMAPAGSTTISKKMKEAIVKDFGSFEAFQQQFEKEATSRFGSGWVWLLKDKKGKLYIVSTANQDNPLMSTADADATILLALDVWEHAYYLKYQSKRADYAKSFWNVVNWKEIEKRYN